MYGMIHTTLLAGSNPGFFLLDVLHLISRAKNTCIPIKVMLYYNRSKGKGERERTRTRNKKKFQKPLDKHQILCYNKDVPRDKGFLLQGNAEYVNGRKSYKGANLRVEVLSPMNETLTLENFKKHLTL